MKFFLDFIRSRIITLVCIIIAAVIFAVVLSLYNLPSEPVLYALLLSLAAVTAIGAVAFIKAYRKHNILTRLANEITVSADNLPKAVSADDKDYGRLIPVSYTHLDVYKRQVLMCATLGQGVDVLLRHLQVSDMASAVIVDSLAGAAIEQVCNRAETEIFEKVHSNSCLLYTSRCV